VSQQKSYETCGLKASNFAGSICTLDPQNGKIYSLNLLMKIGVGLFFLLFFAVFVFLCG